MISDTTVIIKKSILKEINEAAKKINAKRNKIILLLLKYVMKDNKFLVRNGLRGRIQYQARDPLKRWKTVHVWFSKDVSNFCQDMRRFYGMSVSLILAYAVGRFLDEIVNKLLGLDEESDKCDNYLFEGYSFSREEVENGICWTQHWKLKQKT